MLSICQAALKCLEGLILTHVITRNYTVIPETCNTCHEWMLYGLKLTDHETG